MKPSDWEELTFESNKSQQYVEFDKKYNNCYVRVITPGKNEILAKPAGNDGDYFVFARDNGGDFRLAYNSECTLIASFPQTGLVQVESFFLVFGRVPARQHRKAPNKDNCRFIDPLVQGLSLPVQVNQGPSEKKLMAAYYPQFFTWNNAIEMLKSGKYLGVAINNYYGVSLHHTSIDKHLLWMFDICVGEVSSANRTIKLFVESLRQELLDFTRKNLINYLVV